MNKYVGLIILGLAIGVDLSAMDLNWPYNQNDAENTLFGNIYKDEEAQTFYGGLVPNSSIPSITYGNLQLSDNIGKIQAQNTDAMVGANVSNSDPVAKLIVKNADNNFFNLSSDLFNQKAEIDLNFNGLFIQNNSPMLLGSLNSDGQYDSTQVINLNTQDSQTDDIYYGGLLTNSPLELNNFDMSGVQRLDIIKLTDHPIVINNSNLPSDNLYISEESEYISFYKIQKDNINITDENYKPGQIEIPKITIKSNSKKLRLSKAMFNPNYKWNIINSYSSVKFTEDTIITPPLNICIPIINNGEWEYKSQDIQEYLRSQSTVQQLTLEEFQEPNRNTVLDFIKNNCGFTGNTSSIKFVPDEDIKIQKVNLINMAEDEGILNLSFDDKEKIPVSNWDSTIAIGLFPIPPEKYDNTSFINLGLKGNVDLELVGDKSSNKIIFSGDNSEYTGKLTIPEEIDTIEFSNEKSIINNIIFANKSFVNIIIPSNISFNINALGNCFLKIDNSSNILNINSDMSYFSGALVIPENINEINFNNNSISSLLLEGTIDSQPLLLPYSIFDKNIKLLGERSIEFNSTNSTDTLVIKNNNSEFLGNIYIPTEINKISFIEQNSAIPYLFIGTGPDLDIAANFDDGEFDLGLIGSRNVNFKDTANKSTANFSGNMNSYTGTITFPDEFESVTFSRAESVIKNIDNNNKQNFTIFLPQFAEENVEYNVDEKELDKMQGLDFTLSDIKFSRTNNIKFDRADDNSTDTIVIAGNNYNNISGSLSLGSSFKTLHFINEQSVISSINSGIINSGIESAPLDVIIHSDSNETKVNFSLSPEGTRDVRILKSDEIQSDIIDFVKDHSNNNQKLILSNDFKQIKSSSNEGKFPKLLELEGNSEDFPMMIQSDGYVENNENEILGSRNINWYRSENSNSDIIIFKNNASQYNGAYEIAPYYNHVKFDNLEAQVRKIKFIDNNVNINVQFIEPENEKDLNIITGFQGNRNIDLILKGDSVIENISLSGDNSEFSGILNIPLGINELRFANKCSAIYSIRQPIVTIFDHENNPLNSVNKLVIKNNSFDDEDHNNSDSLNISYNSNQSISGYTQTSYINIEYGSKLTIGPNSSLNITKASNK